MLFLGGTCRNVGRVARLATALSAVDVHIEDQVGKGHGPNEVRRPTAAEDVRLVEHEDSGIRSLDRGDHPSGGDGRGTRDRRSAMGGRADERAPCVEAFKLGIELLVAGLHERGREWFVERVIAKDPGIALEVGGYSGPDPVVLALKVADDIIGPEMAKGSSRSRRPVVLRPPARRVGVGRATGAHGPVWRSFSIEQFVVDVLVHVEQGVDVKATEQVDGRLQLGEVRVDDCLAELAWIMGRAGRADGRIVRRSGPRLESLPGQPQPHHVEPEPGHQRGIGGAEVPRFSSGR